MLTHFDRLNQRLSDPLLTVLTLMLSVLLFVIGPMQATGAVTGRHFGQFFALVLLPAAFLYWRNLLVAGLASRFRKARPEPTSRLIHARQEQSWEDQVDVDGRVLTRMLCAYERSWRHCVLQRLPHFAVVRIARNEGLIGDSR